MLGFQVSSKAVLVRKGDFTFGAGERRAVNVYFGIGLNKAIINPHLMGLVEMLGKPLLVGVMPITFGTVKDGTVDIDFSIRIDKGSCSKHLTMHIGAMVSIALYRGFGQLADATVKVGIHRIGQLAAFFGDVSERFCYHVVYVAKMVAVPISVAVSSSTRTAEIIGIVLLGHHARLWERLANAVYRYQVVLVAPFSSVFSITHTAIKVGIVDIWLHTTTLSLEPF